MQTLLFIGNHEQLKTPKTPNFGFLNYSSNRVFENVCHKLKKKNKKDSKIDY